MPTIGYLIIRNLEKLGSCKGFVKIAMLDFKTKDSHDGFVVFLEFTLFILICDAFLQLTVEQLRHRVRDSSCSLVRLLFSS